MAAAPTPRPWRSLSIVAAFLVALYLGLFLGPSATPELGLDLRGGTQVILQASPLKPGGKVAKGQLNQAVNIINQRLNASGVSGAQVNTQGSNTIIVSAPGAQSNQLNRLDQTALLYFRQVLGEAAGTPAPAVTITPSTSGAPSTSGSPVATPTKSAKPPAKKKKSGHDVLEPALLGTKASSSPTPAATTTPTPTPSGTAAPLTTGTSPTPTPSASPSAGETVPPVPNAASTDLAKVQAVFNTYDCSGPQKTSPTQGVDQAQDYIVACDTTGSTKFLLAPAGVKGTQISSATASVNPTTNVWSVVVNFSGSGKNDWFNLTKKAYEADPSQTPTKCLTVDTTKGCNSIAIALDGVVQSAPSSQVDGIAGGNTEITGNFSQQQAQDLANVLKFGALPLKLSQLSKNSISASLGSEQLRGGLIAGMIGLALVIVYSLLYYRALGIVTVASLALSGLILYALTTLLGHSSLGYTLSLPGIAGFIVAVGITADSFVVFFERLRDEVREGRRLRSAVERAWPRARRTIISADAVSLLAAVVLYLVSIGDVRGFAFTLGLSTLSDLFIVFLFTKPLLTLTARTQAFDSGARWTGVGRARVGAAIEPRGA